MKMLENTNCCSAGKEGLTSNPNNGSNGRSLTGKYLFICIPLLAAWWVIYLNLSPVADLATDGLLRLFKLPSAGHLGSAIAFFIYEVPKVLLLLTLVVFGVGIVRSFFTPERTRRILAGKRESVGNVLAAMLGIVTPFCSCSAVPQFLGFVTTGVPLGVTFS
ncbi:MAG: permease, partial [Desulfobacterales bacterium]